MKNCKNCEYAAWDKTKSGRLHPSGNGRCKYPYNVKVKYWTGQPPSPTGGLINRRKDLEDHCAYYGEAK